MPPRIQQSGRLWCRALRLLLSAAFGLTAAGAFAAVVPSPTIDSIVIRLRDDVRVDPSSGLPVNERDALYGAMQIPFSQTGLTRDGAYQLQLLNPVQIDAARAAINRVRLLPQVLYANLVAPAPALGGAGITAKAARVATNAGVATGAAPVRPPVSRLIVKFRDAATSEAARRNEPLASALVDRISARAGRTFAHERAMSGGAYVVRLFQALPADQAGLLAALLAADATIEYAEPDLLVQPQLVPNDPLYTSQWHYMSPPAEKGGVNLPPAWDITTGSPGVVVAVIDTGSLPSHPDLAGRFVGGYDFISYPQNANDGNGRDADPSDPGDWMDSADVASGNFPGCGTSNSSFHGTHVAGTIGAASGNGIGVAGINWVSKILPARVLGKCGGYVSDIADAIRWSAGLAVPGVPSNANPARVLNLSLGGYACDFNDNCACDATLQNAINAALSANAVVVVAAGNAAVDAIEFLPANCNGVITVGATGRAGQRASYSNFGPLVEISAPGGSDGQSVLSTLNSGATSPDPEGFTYAYYQGTSMATPHVSGIASLMLSRNPALTPAQVVSKIQTTARPFPTGTGRDCTSALCGAGIIDAGAAVLAAAGVSTSSVALSSSLNPATAGASVTFTATVTGSNPTGSVNFTADGSTSLNGCNAVALTGSGNSRIAVCSTASLAVGTHSLVANYAGDAANAASSSAAFSQVINASSSAAASFVGTDLVTQGNWKGHYGSDGYAIDQ